MYKAQPHMIVMLAEKKKCIMCRHKEEEGHILPSVAGKFNPSAKWAFHYEDTHGLPHEYVVDWLFKMVYQDENGNSMLSDMPYTQVVQSEESE